MAAKKKTTTSKKAPAKKTTRKTKKKGRSEFDKIALAWGSDIATRGVVKKDVPVWSTGLCSLDIATACGGYPKSCVVEIFGPNQAGKTLLALVAMAQMARFENRPCLFLDLESETTSKWMLRHGMVLELIDHVTGLPPGKKKGYVGVPSGEALVDGVVDMIKEGEYGFIVLDSVASLMPSELVGKSLQDGKARGIHSNFIGDALKHIVPIMQKTDMTMLAMNQIRMKADATFGNPEYTTGGLALAHWKAMSVRVQKSSQESRAKDRPGADRKFKVIKNKKGEPFGTAEPFLHRRQGLLVFEDLFTTAVRQEVLVRTRKKTGPKYRIEELDLGFSGKESFVDLVADDVMLLKDIWSLTVKRGLEQFDAEEGEGDDYDSVLDDDGEEESED